MCDDPFYVNPGRIFEGTKKETKMDQILKEKTKRRKRF